MLMTTAVICLAMSAYHEARSEPLIAQIAVSQVALNRAGHDPKKVCAVITKPHQFSWTSSKLRLDDGVYRVTKKGLPKDKQAWGQALTVAKLVLAGLAPDVVHGATFYHERSVHPRWDRGLKLVASYGVHLFYKLV